MTAADWPWQELEARVTGDWTATDSNLAIADPRESYAVVDIGVMYVPPDLVGIVRCPVCHDDYANRAFLRAHQEQEHPARDAKRTHPAREPAPTSRPASVPAPADAAKVRPLRSETEGASGASGASRSMRPEPESVPPARVPNNRGRRRGAPRSKPKRRD